MSHPTRFYRGRFAPSPSGPLHFGSLIAAVGSYLDAKRHNGEWLVRMEDLDPPREKVGAAESILHSLEAFGFEWDGEVIYQSQRYDLYADALHSLQQKGLLYYCDCIRKNIIARCSHGAYGAIYDGYCSDRELPEAPNQAIRIRVKGDITFNDRLQGSVIQDLQQDIGDFHLLRRDGLYAYHIGVVVDDAEQGITDIVRGYDLLDSTPRQIYLQKQLDYLIPQYAHLPLALKPDGDKLSKQNQATAINDQNPVPGLWEALNFLGQQPPSELKREQTVETLWDWAIQNWTFEEIPKTPGQVTHIL